MNLKASPSKLGNYLRELRVSKGLTLQALADAIGIDLSSLSKIELGERALSLDLVPSLARALQIDFKSLQVDIMALKVAEEFGGEEFAVEGLKMAVNKLKRN